MKIANANICLDDDTLFVGEECPQCFGHSFYPLRKWLAPLHSFNEIKEKQNAKRNLQIQEGRKESLLPTTHVDIIPDIGPEILSRLDERFFSRNKGPVVKGCGLEYHSELFYNANPTDALIDLLIWVKGEKK